ncbi:helix-turn-helix domain-containing protein [Mesonia aestuariivivens]|uniref:Helix-turn-helix domain-containing protein n=1 Tax=Mesonia aestuariivivens TaxID=2796128 RepID=A0ABS6VXW2_9FLAO|nr:helix-turn-helix domain-containing protein [Mesonia aestuariivivens]MBW2960425.1 helix-turn-helix domain-containing protein [Mesonia aestuariivivens]
MEERKIIINEITVDELTEKIADKLFSKIKAVLESNIEQENKLLSRKEAAAYLQISQGTLWNWSKSGRLKSYGLGSRVYYKQKEIDEVLERNKL